MKIVCDNCTTKYSIADEKVRGKVFKIKCKKCSHIIVVKGEPTTGEGQPAGFDQKETRVFDYSGFEGQRGAAGSDTGGASAADPIWHLVIDREQVGPLTVTELIAKWDGGEIDRETYAWREGFADWQRLGAIDELSQVVRRGGAPARGEGAASGGDDRSSLFGDATSTPAAGSPMPARSNPADLFAGAGTSTEDEVPSDLFGGSDRAASPGPSVFASSAAPAAPQPSRRSAPKEDLFGGSSDVDMSHADGGDGRADVRPMTGQRNENSVLFSLNNLSALAGAGGGGDAPSPRSSGGGGGGGGLSSFGSAGSSGAEGSGLIDIRAMAQMTMGASRREESGARSRRHSEDDLPVFSASSFSAPAAGVLLPTVQPQNNRMMIILMAAFAFLAVAAIILLAVIIFGGKGVSPTDPTLASSNPIATAPPSPSPSTTTPPPATTTPTTPPPTRPSTTPAAPATTPATTPRDERPAPAVVPRPEPRRPTTTAPAAPTRPVETRPEPRPPEPPPRPASTEPPVPKAQKCDEVACLVTPDLPCCPKRGGTPTRPSSDSGLPDKLEQSDIISGMKAVNGRVMACNDRHRVPGAFKVKVTVSPDGNVTNASASPPIGGTAAAGCVENAVRGARFKKTKNSITFNYPYTFR